MAHDSIKISNKLHNQGKPVVGSAKLALLPEVRLGTTPSPGWATPEQVMNVVNGQCMLRIFDAKKTPLFTGFVKFNPKIELEPLAKVNLEAVDMLSVLKDEKLVGADLL